MTTRQPLKPSGRPNQYFAVGDVGRKTGWQPKGNINQDEQGFDDIEQFFGDDDEQPKQVANLPKPSIKYGNSGAGSEKRQKKQPTSDFVSKPLVGRTPPAAPIRKQQQQQQPLFLNEQPTRRPVPLDAQEIEVGPYGGFKASRRISNQFAPSTQSKLRNSISQQDLQDDDDEKVDYRNRLAPRLVATVATKSVAAKAYDSSDEEETGGPSALRKRLGLSNPHASFSTSTTLASSIVDLPSMIKSTAVKPISTIATAKRPIQHSPAAPLPTQVSNRKESMSNPKLFAPEETHDDSLEPVEQQDFFDDVYNDEPVASFDQVEQEAYNDEEIPIEKIEKVLSVVKKPSFSTKRVNIVIEKEEEEQEEAKQISFANDSHFQDNYGSTDVAGVSSSDPDEFEFQLPSGADVEDEESAHIYDDEEEEEEVVVKPKKSTKSKKASSSSKKATRKPTPSIPSKYEGMGERIGPNAVKIPVQRVHYDEEEEGLRKSKRSRIAPVAFWKNEKAVYGRRDSGITLQNVIRVFDEQQASKPRTMTKSKGGNGNVTTVTVKSKAGKKSSGSSKKEYDIPEPPAEIKVINYITKQEEFQKIAVTPHNLDVNRSVSTGSYNFQKVFGEGEFFASGVLELPAGSSKPSKNSHGSAMVFAVVSGMVQVEVHKTSFTLAEGGQFFVPRGNQYSILNVGSEEARLYFCHGKLINSF